MNWLIRPGADADGPALIALIRSCWSLYSGIRMDVDREMPELHALASHYTSQGGMLWVGEMRGGVRGMIAVRSLADQTWEVCRLYVDPPLHGSGLGCDLLNQAERHAMAEGAGRLVLWSDTRFDRAHRFYEKRSYIRLGAVRVLHDISNSLEFGYAKPVNGLEMLDIAAAGSAVGRLADILIACVRADLSVVEPASDANSFPEPINLERERFNTKLSRSDSGASAAISRPPSVDKVRAFWRQAASQIASEERLLIAAWEDGVLVGIGMLDLATPDDQKHRCDIQKILVDPSARRARLTRQILLALERAAASRGRTLLTLHTRAGDANEALYRADRWEEAGRIPGFTRDADGTAHATVFFWKTLNAQRKTMPEADFNLKPGSPS